jgi:hypothetical protein
MRKCGGNAISARRKVYGRRVDRSLFFEGRKVDGSLFLSFLMMSGLQKSDSLRLMYQAKLLSFHVKDFLTTNVLQFEFSKLN